MSSKDDLIEPMLAASSNVASICRPLFNSTPINHLHYYEIGPDGGVFSFGGNEKHYRDFYESKLLDDTLHKLIKTIRYEGFSILDLRSDKKWVREELKKALAFDEEKWLFGHSCRYIIRKKSLLGTSVCIFFFKGDVGENSLNDFYLNNLTNLKYFSRYFCKEIDPFKNNLSPYPAFKENKQELGHFIQGLASVEVPTLDFLFSFSPKKKLSKRQLEIVKWYLKGKTTGETAEILGISKFTLESHIERIKQKLNCRSKPQIVSELLKDGLFLD